MIEMRSWIRRIKNNSWRWQLRKRRIFRWFQYFDWKNDLPSFRWLVLLFVVGLSVVLIDALFCWVTDCGYVWFSFCATKTLLAKVAQANTPSSATVLLALYSAPAAYIIWWFRDANNRQQIENQRKDVNLKDFQRLAEWAAGMHLPEDKVVESEKKTNNLETKNVANSSEEKNSNTIETNRSVESFIAPNNHILHTPSRREGAVSLQVAAIYQLQAFLQGDYGKHFQRPAFQLLKSIWLVLVTPHLDKLNEVMQQERDFANLEEIEIFSEDIETWRNELADTISKPIGQAINIALGTQQGWLLRNHAVDLSNSIFTGYNSCLASLKQPLELDGLHLQRIQLQGASLSYAQLQRTNLRFAKMQGADLSYAQLQGASLNMARLQGANLASAQMQGGNFEDAQMQLANLTDAQLQKASLINTNLYGAYLWYANLQGAFLLNVEVEMASFKFAETDNVTQVFKIAGMRIIRYGNGKYVTFPEGSVIKPIETFCYREKLRDENKLVLPDILYKQLFAKPTEYTVLNSNGEKEKKFGVGLRTEF